MKKFFLISGVMLVTFVVAARVIGNYIFTRPGGFSGKPKDISASADFLSIVNQCPNVNPTQLNMSVAHAALLGYRDPEWLLTLRMPAANMKDFKAALSACYQRKEMKDQKRTIKFGESLRRMSENSRTNWWEAETISNPDIWSFYVGPYMDVQLVFAPEKNVVYARMFSW